MTLHLLSQVTNIRGMIFAECVAVIVIVKERKIIKCALLL